MLWFLPIDRILLAERTVLGLVVWVQFPAYEAEVLLFVFMLFVLLQFRVRFHRLVFRVVPAVFLFVQVAQFPSLST